MDIIDIKCLGLCQHGGVCSMGACICPAGYHGSYCEHVGGTSILYN